MGHAVAQLVEELRYKPEGRGFDSDKEASSAMDIGKRRLLQNTTAERTDLTRPYRLLEVDQMEDVPEAKPQRTRGKSLHQHRHGGVNTSGE
jgi:hypothetical protein